MHLFALAPTAALLTLLTGPTPNGVVPDESNVVEGPGIPIEPDWWAYPSELPPDIDPDKRPRHHATKQVWLNFDGGRANSSIYSGMVNPFLDDKGLRAAVVQSVRNRLADFDFSITWDQPSGDHDVEMVGEWADRDPGGAAGIAPAGDCWDQRGGETSFTMLGGGSSDGVAEVILQEIAHTWGLAHVDEQQDLLFPTTQGSNKTYMNECFQIVRDTDLTPGSDGCSHHQQACGSNSMQNSYAELDLIFGPSTPDMAPPSVQILAPTEGETVMDPFDLRVNLADNLIPAIIKTRIEVVDLASSSSALASPSEYKFPMAGLPEGTHTIVVSIEDESGNPASAMVTFHVGKAGDWEPPPGATSGDGGTSGGDGGDGTGDGGGSGAEGGTLTGTATDGLGGGGDDGCGCRSTAPAGSVALLVLAALGVRRRD